MAEFVESGAAVSAIDCGVRNKFKWRWMGEKDAHGVSLSDYIRKTKTPGKAFCLYCESYILYGSTGKKAIMLHAQSMKHVQKRELRPTSQLSSVKVEPDSPNDHTGAGNLRAPRQTPGKNAIMKRVQLMKRVQKRELRPNDRTGGNVPAPRQTHAVGARRVTLPNRRANLEATLMAFGAEHNLPFSLFPELVKLCKQMARDPQALSKIQMGKTCASFKITEGLNRALRAKLLFDLKRYPFSVNLVQYTNNSNSRILMVLVSYYSEEEEKVVVKHYESIQLVYENAKSVHDAVLQAFKRDGIPLTNLISALSNNAFFMQGNSATFESLLRVEVPHLLNLGGGTCHDAHSIVGRFCNNFEGYHEKLLDDLHADFKWSADLKENLKDVCSILNVDFIVMKEREPHRWLSVYDCTLPVDQIFHPLTLLYMAWVSPEALETNAQVKELCSILMPCEDGKIKAIEDMHKELRCQNMIDEVKSRKERIVERLFFSRVKTLLHMHLYIAVLKRFKTYVEIFEKNEPHVHQLCDEQEHLLKEFLSHFIKIDVLNSSKDLREIDVKDLSVHAPTSYMYLGLYTRQVLKELDETSALRSEFICKVRAAYVDTAGYMQQKLCSSPVVKCMAALDPKAKWCSVTAAKLLSHLAEHFEHLNILSREEKADYENEVRRLQIDNDLPDIAVGMRLDTWWTMLFNTGRYPCMNKIVKACLSIFTSSQVKVSHSSMNDVICTDTNQVDVETFSALQTIRYYLKSKESPPKKKQSKKLSTSLQLFQRDDVKKDPVDSLIARHMLEAHRMYRKTVMQKKKKKEVWQKPAASAESIIEPPEKKIRKEQKVKRKCQW